MEQLDLSIVHAFAEFQSILRAVMTLNEFLQCPFQLVCPSKVYNGVFLYNVFGELKRKKDPHLFIFELLGTLSDDLKDLINLLDKVSDNRDRGDEDNLNSEEASNTDGWQNVTYKKRYWRKQPKLDNLSYDVKDTTNFSGIISDDGDSGNENPTDTRSDIVDVRDENTSCSKGACVMNELPEATYKKQSQEQQTKCELLDILLDDVKDKASFSGTQSRNVTKEKEYPSSNEADKLSDNVAIGKGDPSNKGAWGTDGWQQVTYRKGKQRKQQQKHMKKATLK